MRFVFVFDFGSVFVVVVVVVLFNVTVNSYGHVGTVN